MDLKENIRYELSKELFFQVKLDGIIKDVTSNCFNITGYTQEEIIGCKLGKFIRDEDLVKLLNDFDKDNIEIVFQHKNGKNIYMNTRKKVLINNNQKVLYVCITDITKYKCELDRARRLMGIFERANDIIFSVKVKPKMKFEYLSPSILKNLGYSIEEHNENPNLPFEIAHPDDYEYHIKKTIGDIDYSKKYYIRYRHKNGQYIWFEECIIPIYNNVGKLVALEGITRNIHERKQLEEKLRYLSYHDTLTGIYNRTYFDKEKEKLDKEINVPIGIIICDIDNLKTINDTLGHEAGDKLIKLTSELIMKSINESIIAARIGGDEFAIILEDIEFKEVELTVKNIKELIQEYNSKNPEIPILVSIGFEYSSKSKGYIEEIIRKADRNMYKDKQRRKVS